MTNTTLLEGAELPTAEHAELPKQLRELRFPDRLRNAGNEAPFPEGNIHQLNSVVARFDNIHSFSGIAQQGMLAIQANVTPRIKDPKRRAAIQIRALEKLGAIAEHLGVETTLHQGVTNTIQDNVSLAFQSKDDLRRTVQSAVARLSTPEARADAEERGTVLGR